MRSHAHDLRAEVTNDWGVAGEAADLLVHQIARDWRTAALSTEDVMLCQYAEKLTRDLEAVTEADVAALRGAGFSDRGIHDATQVIGYFNYINRIADGLGVEPEGFVRPWELSPLPLPAE